MMMKDDDINYPNYRRYLIENTYKKLEKFIKNGVEYGYISIPEEPDVKECNREFDCIGYAECLERYARIVKVGPSDPKVNNFCDGCVAYRQKKDDMKSARW